MNAAELLDIWEVAARLTPRQRVGALLGIGGHAPADSLGARNAGLFRLRASLFGTVQQLRCDCPQCGASCEFAVDCETLARAALPAPEAVAPQRLDCAGFTVDFRVPNITDVEAAAGEDAFEEVLLARCVGKVEHPDGRACALHELTPAVFDALSQRMEELEPGASVSFEVDCPDCAHHWSAPMDVGEVLWTELQARAERLLIDIDALARAYSWNEEQILALSPTRRAAYLQLTQAVQ